MINEEKIKECIKNNGAIVVAKVIETENLHRSISSESAQNGVPNMIQHSKIEVKETLYGNFSDGSVSSIGFLLKKGEKYILLLDSKGMIQDFQEKADKREIEKITKNINLASGQESDGETDCCCCGHNHE